MLITIVVGIFAVIKASKGLQDMDSIKREQSAVRLIGDTFEAWYSPVMTDVDFFDKKAGCPSGWKPIYQVYWPGVKAACAQPSGTVVELRKRDRTRNNNKGRQ